MDDQKDTKIEGYSGLELVKSYCRSDLIVNSIWQFTKSTSGYFISYTINCGDFLFKPSWGITVAGFIPFVGNFANFGAALHAYRHGETWFGHQKILETVVGTSMDLATMGATTGGWKLTQAGINSANLGLFAAGSRILIGDLAQHTFTRLTALGAVQYMMNPPYYKY